MHTGSTIQRLKIGGNNFSGYIELVLGLRTLVGGYSLVQCLCLSKAGLSDSLGQLTFGALKGNNSLETLLLRDNGLGALTARAFGELLKNTNTSLRKVDLARNFIDVSFLLIV